MVSKSKFLAVVLSSLVLVSGSRALAADQSLVQQTGNQSLVNVKKQKSTKGQRQRATSVGKTGSIQDQGPVSAKGKPSRKGGNTIQDQVPVSAKGKSGKGGSIQVQGPARQKSIFVNANQKAQQGQRGSRGRTPTGGNIVNAIQQAQVIQQ